MTGAPAFSPPTVSVVLPTRGRADLLLSRALPSALAQTLENLEVVVVVDGPDSATEAALRGVTDPRVRVIVLPEPQGGAEARNVGVRAARGEWIALLDDDDEWLPDKLERQLAVARATPGRPVVACFWITRTPHGEYPSPARLPDPGEALGDYMLARKTFSARTCGLVSTLLFTPRELLLALPFTPGLPRHQDWDWLLRAAALPDVRLAFVPETLAVWYYEEQRPSVSRQTNWRSSLAWARGHHAAGRLSNRALVGFLNSHVAPAAQRAGDPGAVWVLGRELLRARPRPFELLRFAATWVASTKTRRALRTALDRALGRLRGALWRVGGRRGGSGKPRTLETPRR